MLKGSNASSKKTEEDCKHFFTVQVIVCLALVPRRTLFSHGEATETWIWNSKPGELTVCQVTLASERFLIGVCHWEWSWIEAVDL